MAKGSFGEILKRERELREVTLYEVTLAMPPLLSPDAQASSPEPGQNGD